MSDPDLPNKEPLDAARASAAAEQPDEAPPGETPTVADLDASAAGATPLGQPAGRHGARFASTIAVLAFVLSMLSLVASYYLWSRGRSFDVAIANFETRSSAQLEGAEASLASLDTRIAELAAETTTRGSRIRELEDRVGDLPGEIAAIGRRVDALQGGAADSRGKWLEAEAEYYLVVANSELRLANRLETASAALELANDRLRALGNPIYAPVRELIAGELLSLRSIRLPDTTGLAFSLIRLAERVADLPMREGAPSDYALSAPGEAPAETGLARLWNTTKQAFSSFIRIERSNEPTTAALTVAERELAQRQLVAELQLARIAIASRNSEGLKASVTAATALLRNNFATGAGEVQGALALLNELGEVELAPALPDISGSLVTLRNLAAGDD